MITYKLYQDNRRNNPNQGKWYARALHAQTINTAEIAAIIQRNCSVKHSDVVAVLTELVEVMQDELQDGKRVKLNGFGTFKINLKSIAADTAADFKVSKHIVGARVNFFPATTIDGTRKRHKVLLDGVQFAETPKNDVVTDAEDEGNDENP